MKNICKLEVTRVRRIYVTSQVTEYFIFCNAILLYFCYIEDVINYCRGFFCVFIRILMVQRHTECMEYPQSRVLVKI